MRSRLITPFFRKCPTRLSGEGVEKKAIELKDAVDTAKKEYDKVKPGEDKDFEADGRSADKAEKKPNAANRFLKSWARNSRAAKEE